MWKSEHDRYSDEGIRTSSTSSIATNTMGGRPALQTTKKEKWKRHVFDQGVIEILLEECVLEDRRFRLKIYPHSFLGHQAVTVLVDHGYTDTRGDAVRLVRRTNQKYHLFHHVTNDHLLCDKHLFCTYRKG